MCTPMDPHILVHIGSYSLVGGPPNYPDTIFWDCQISIYIEHGYSIIFQSKVSSDGVELFRSEKIILAPTQGLGYIIEY